MYIKSWGSRGSIPVSGKEYIKYGGDTACVEIRAESGEIIIVDAGTGIRRLGNQLIQEKRHDCHLIFTHAHWDHLIGFPFFRPLYLDRSDIRIHGCPFALRYVHTMLSKVMSPPNFPVSFSDVKARIDIEQECPMSFHIGSIQVSRIRLSHPNQGSGYKFVENGKTFVFITDNELDFIHPGGLEAAAYEEFAAGADLLIHDGEFTPEEYKTFKTWGHSNYRSVLSLALRGRVREIGLFHLNQDRTDDDMDRIVDDCRAIIESHGSPLKCFGVSSDMTFNL